MGFSAQAWWLLAPGQPLVHRELWLQAPGPGQALVEVLACGLCHTDLGYADGSVPPKHALPLVLGHEVVGTVLAAGEGAEHLIGQSVIVPAVLPCGNCAFCKAGRANAVAPFAWTRMTASIPAKDPAAQARLARLQQLDPAQVAPLVAVLCSEAAKDINGQVFAVRGSEITLFEPMRPTRSLHRNGGWTSADLAESLPAAFRGSLAPLQVTSDVFGYEPLT